MMELIVIGIRHSCSVCVQTGLVSAPSIFYFFLQVAVGGPVGSHPELSSLHRLCVMILSLFDQDYYL